MVIWCYRGVAGDAFRKVGVIDDHSLPAIEGVAYRAHPRVVVGWHCFCVAGEAIAGRGMHEGDILPAGCPVALPALSVEMIGGTGVKMAC